VHLRFKVESCRDCTLTKWAGVSALGMVLVMLGCEDAMMAPGTLYPKHKRHVLPEKRVVLLLLHDNGGNHSTRKWKDGTGGKNEACLHLYANVNIVRCTRMRRDGVFCEEERLVHAATVVIHDGCTVHGFG
jgi:hypothetical protein